MLENYRRYPIGIQNFEQLRNHHCVYVDKTELIYRLTHTDSVYFFSRPRRFGKSLLLSTLKAYFEGKRDLFKGLKIESLEKEWHKHPMFHIDFNGVNFTEAGALKRELEGRIIGWEKEYGIVPEVDFNLASRFEKVVQAASERYGRRAVVLVDEYDKPWGHRLI